MADEAGDFRFAGAYVELNLRDNTVEQEKAIRSRIEGGKPVEIPTTLGAPTNDPFRDRPVPPVEIPTTATNPIDDAWRARVQASLRDTTKTALDVPLTSDTAEYRDDLALKLKAIRDSLRQDIPANLAEADEYKLKVEALVREVSDSLAVRLKVEVDPASAARVEAEIKSLEDLATRSANSASSSPTATASVAAAGGGAGTGGLLALGGALGAGVIGGASLLAIPAVITAIGVAAEHSSPQVTQAFSQMTAAAKTSVQEGFAPFAPALAKFADEAKTTITGLEPQFYAASSAAAPLLQIVGHDFLSATQAGVGASVPIIQGMRPVAQALGDDLTKLEQGIAGFFRNIDVGSAAQGLTAVGNVIKEDLPALGSLISDIAPLGNALLNVLAPALASAVSEFGFVRPVAEAVGSVLQFLSPAISAVAGPVVALEVATKLLTGSWTDWGGALDKVKPLFTDTSGVLDNLAGKIGITTASAKASAVQSAQDAATKAALKAEVDKLALAEAEEAVANDASAKNKLALIAAQETEAESAAAATAAQDSLTSAEEASTVAMGPLGIVLGVVGGALALVGLNSEKATPPAQDLTAQMVKLAQAAPDAAAGILQGDPALQGLINNASKAGISVTNLLDSYAGGPQALQEFSDALNKQHQSLGDTTVDIRHAGDGYYNASVNMSQAKVSIKDLTDEVNRHQISLSNLPPDIQKLVTEYGAQKDVQDQLGTSISDLRQQQDAANAIAARAAQQTQLTSSQQQQASGIAAALGISIDSVTSAFQDYVAGVTFGMTATEKMSDQFLTQTLAVDTANSTIANYFKTADAGVVSAQQSLSDAQHSAAQAADAVANAQHSLAQSAQAVITAQQGVATAQQAVITADNGVVTAEQNLTRAQQSEQQAQVALTQARQAAAQQLISLHLQLNDQVAAEEAANLKLVQQTETAAASGITQANAAQIAAQTVTSTNRAQIQAALDLVDAMNSVADTMNTGVNLRQQVTAADQAGVNNAPSVLSAQQALVQAQQQVASSAQAVVTAQQAVVTAQAGVVKAEQGVTDAVYNEAQARKAVADAAYNHQKALQAVGTAETALGVAQDAASHSMDINTAAGQRNLAMLQQVAQQLFNNEEPQKAANDLVSNTATLFGISTTAAQNYLKQLGLIPQNFQFSITAVANANLNELNNAYATILNRGVHATPGLPVPYAGGGPIVGPGGPRDDLVPILASSHEFMQPADAHDYYGTAFMEAIRQKRIPKDAIKGYASGGAIGPYYDSLAIAGMGVDYQTAVDALTVLGAPSPPAPPSLPAYVPPPASVISGSLGLGAGVTGSRAANEALMQQIFASQFGWTGPEWAATQYLMMRESGFNNTAQNPTSTAYGQFQFLDCVPLDTEILTQDGWKTWDQVEVGDRTLGYNQRTGCTEWTPILARVVKRAQPVVRISVGNWSARVTPGHRWMSERRTTSVQEHALKCPECGATSTKRGPFLSSRAVQTHLGRKHGAPREQQMTRRVEEFVRTDSITKAHRLRVAAPVRDDVGNDTLSNAEVALLGWIVGDGHINDSNRTVNVWVYQSKTRFVPVIDALLDGVPHSRYVRDREPGRLLPAVSWRLSSAYARDLLRRSRLLDGAPDDFVLSLSTKQRQIWLDAVWQAEGWTVKSGEHGTVARLSQNVGPWADAMTLAVYLCGYRPTRHLRDPRRTNPNSRDNWVITLGRPWIGGTQIDYTELEDEPVWCVNTELGTWTMRQGGLPMLTGNSTWAGYGIPKTSDPAPQDIAGGRYILARYGDPIAAAAHERQFNWYDWGGYAKPGDTLVRNATSLPEMVLPPGMTQTMEALNAAIQGTPNAAAPATQVVHHHSQQFHVSTQDPYVAAKLVAAQQAWNNMIGAHT